MAEELTAEQKAARKAENAAIFAAVDKVLNDAPLDESPWTQDAPTGEYRYHADLDLAKTVLAIPIGKGRASEQRSGIVARTLDRWVAHEFRRAGFDPEAVFPRQRDPRSLAPGLAPIQDRATKLVDALSRFEAKNDAKLPNLPSLRTAINALAKAASKGDGKTRILGRFYEKEVDVAIVDWRRGPDAMISTKTQLSSYVNNLKTRHEEAVGESDNLRGRFPMAAMGFVYLVRDNIFEEKGAYEVARDILLHLRKPHGYFDATMLLVGSWDESNVLTKVDAPADDLGADLFFKSMIEAVILPSPAALHREVRDRRSGTPKGGSPDPDAMLVPADDDEIDLDELD